MKHGLLITIALLLMFSCSTTDIKFDLHGSFDMKMKTETATGEVVETGDKISCSFGVDNKTGEVIVDAGCVGAYEKDGNIYKCKVGGTSDGKPIRDYFLFETDCEISLEKKIE